MTTKKISQKQIILNLLASQPNRKFKGYELTKVNTLWGWLGSQADRRARELASAGSVNHGIEGGYAVYWNKIVIQGYTVQKGEIRDIQKAINQSQLSFA